MPCLLSELSFPHASYLVKDVRMADIRLASLVYASTYCVPIATLRQNKPFRHETTSLKTAAMETDCTFVFVCFFFFLHAAAEIMLTMLFNTLLKITPHNMQKRRRKERIKKGPLRRYSQWGTYPVPNPALQGLT